MKRLLLSSVAVAACLVTFAVAGKTASLAVATPRVRAEPAPAAAGPAADAAGRAPALATFERARVPVDMAPSHPSMATLGSQVMQQLEIEKRQRKPVALPSEDVAAAFARAGFSSEPLKQGLGQPIGASYCAMSLTENGVAFTICEFADDAATRAGKQRSEARWGAGNTLGRTLVANGRSLLIVRPAVANDVTKREAANMARVFERME